MHQITISCIITACTLLAYSVALIQRLIFIANECQPLNLLKMQKIFMEMQKRNSSIKYHQQSINASLYVPGIWLLAHNGNSGNIWRHEGMRRILIFFAKNKTLGSSNQFVDSFFVLNFYDKEDFHRNNLTHFV